MNKKPVLVVENCLNGLTLNEKTSVDKKNGIILTGVFTEFDVKNRNERIYTKDRFLPHLKELTERMNVLGAIYGEFDHPDVFDTSLSRVSHVIKDITFNESQNRIDGSIQLLNTHFGREAQALVEGGFPIFVSSRAAGVTESDGTVTIKKLFTYDAVADPGFASTRMSVKILNESLGFNESANFRIYDMTDESKFNELYKMNKENQPVTLNQMDEYSQHLTSEMIKIKNDIEKNIKEGFNPEEFLRLSEQYEILMENFKKVSSYLDYLAEKMQFLVTENDSLKEKTNNLVKHNDYLAENLEKSINYSTYLSEKVNDNVNYAEYIAEKLDQSIQFAEYIAENTQETIHYSEYLAEQIDNNIQFSEYLAENTEFTIKENAILREYVDNSIKYSEYLAENVDNSIKYSTYLAENVDNHIKYSEYLANEVNDTQAYSKYIAESLDKTIDGIKTKKINENNGDLEDQGIVDFNVQDSTRFYQDDIDDSQVQMQSQEDGQVQMQSQDDSQVQSQDDMDDDMDDDVVMKHDDSQTEFKPMYDQSILGKTVKVETEDGLIKSGEVLSYNASNGIAVVEITPEIDNVQGQAQEVQSQVQTQGQVQEIQVHESKLVFLNKDEKLYNKELSIKESISQLINETKKRKSIETAQPHFLLFLTKENQENWNTLSVEDKEKVIVKLNESNYTSEKEILNIIRETISTPVKTDEQVLIDYIPNDLVEIWNGLNNTVKKSVLAQAKFYPNLTKSEAKMESFWNTRNLSGYVLNESKTLISEKMNYVNDSKLSQKQIDAYINKFKNL